MLIDGTVWTSAFRAHLGTIGLGSDAFSVPANDQLNELPWTNLNRVKIRFSENVVVAPGDLTVHGAGRANYAVPSFDYNPLTFTASWTLASNLAAEKVLLNLSDGVTDAAGNALDGEWAGAGAGPDTFPSGDGTDGGPFRFRFNVLGGDVNRSGGAVDATDYLQVRSRNGTSPASPGTSPNTYSVFHDVNGSGDINSVDQTHVRYAESRSLPGGEPALPAILLSATATSAERIALSWSPVAGATSYRVEISADGIEFHDEAEFDASATTAAAENLGPGQRFYYRVFAVDSSGDLGVSNFADATTLAAAGSMVAPAGSAPPAAAGDKLVVSFHGAYTPGSNPLDVYGNAWFERIARDAGGWIKPVAAPVRPSDQVTYNYTYGSQNSALFELLDRLDVNDDLVISATEATAAEIVVTGFSWGAVTAGNFTRLLREDYIMLPGGGNAYILNADIPVKLLLMIDPVHDPITRVIHQMSGPVETNVQRFVNFYQRRGGETAFDLWLGGSTGNGSNFSPFTKVGREEQLSNLPFDGPLKGRAMKYKVAPANVVQINVNLEGQRHATNVEYFFDPTREAGLYASDNYFDADLTASGTEHNAITWYVRGGLGPSFSSELNVLWEIDNA